jgi:hypothetical protein
MLVQLLDFAAQAPDIQLSRFQLIDSDFV